MNKSFREAFKNDGYYLIKNELNSDLVRKTLQGTDDMIEAARKGRYSKVRVYRDYPYSFGGINVWGLEYPTNNLIATQGFTQFFDNYDLEKLVLDATGWERTACILLRIHTSDNNFNYQGTWHRDVSKDKPDSIMQVNIYLKDETGFRIVPTHQEANIAEESLDEGYLTCSDSMCLNEKFFDELSANSGDVLLFKGSALHQGVYTAPRRHLHMRFLNMDEFSDQQYVRISNVNFIETYAPDAEIVNPGLTYTMSYSIKSILLRWVRVLNYIFPILKCFRERKILFGKKTKNIHYSVLSNTVWQQYPDHEHKTRRQ